VAIIIIKNNFQTLANIVIADLICTDLMQCASTIITHTTIVAIQDKTQSYTKQTP
jgi:hypothetical protein